MNAQPSTDCGVVVTIESLEFREAFEGSTTHYCYPPQERPRFVLKGVPEDDNGVLRLVQQVTVPVIEEVVTLDIEVAFRPRTGVISIDILEFDKPRLLPESITGDLIEMWPQGCNTSVTYGGGPRPEVRNIWWAQKRSR